MKAGKAARSITAALIFAQMNALAWWTGCNPVRMERLFNRSALARGNQRKTRLAIAKAIADPTATISAERSAFAKINASAMMSALKCCRPC